MRVFIVLSVIGAAWCRPEPPSNFVLDSYAAPLPSGGGGNYPSANKPVYGPPSLPPVIHKHVYVHVPPPEEYTPQPYLPPPQRPPQKHYKIVFIKAPTPPTPTAPAIPPPVQDQEKTLIYVLVKKPELPPTIEIPTAPPTPPSKPEVYFIRYRTQTETPPSGYPDSGVPEKYGPPSNPPSNDYGAPPSTGYGAPSR